MTHASVLYWDSQELKKIKPLPARVIHASMIVGLQPSNAWNQNMPDQVIS